jgi:hypothetical protein
MSKSKLPSEFAFQLIALLTAVIIVHGFYVGLIRPLCRRTTDNPSSATGLWRGLCAGAITLRRDSRL